MQKNRADLLKEAADKTATTFSIQDRGGNVLKETFEVHRIVVLGETTAAVVFLKSSGKKAVAFYYFVNSRAKPRWEYFFVSYAHLASLRHLELLLFEIEQHNFDAGAYDT